MERQYEVLFQFQRLLASSVEAAMEEQEATVLHLAGIDLRYVIGNICLITWLGNLKDSAFFPEKVSAFFRSVSGIFPEKKRKLFPEKKSLLSFKIWCPLVT